MSATLTQWPALEELEAVREKLADAFSALDALDVRYQVLNGDYDPADVVAEGPQSPVDAAMLGHVVRFVENLENDKVQLVMTMKGLRNWPRQLAWIQEEQEHRAKQNDDA